MTRTDHHPLGHEQYLLYFNRSSHSTVVYKTRHKWNNIILAFNYRSPQLQMDDGQTRLLSIPHLATAAAAAQHLRSKEVNGNIYNVSYPKRYRARMLIIKYINRNGLTGFPFQIDLPMDRVNKRVLPVTDGPPSYSAPSSNII